MELVKNADFWISPRDSFYLIGSEGLVNLDFYNYLRSSEPSDNGPGRQSEVLAF